MKRWEVVFAIAGAILIVLSALATRRGELPHRDTLIIAADCHMPVTILEPRGKARGVAILFHGLSADRRIMESFGEYLTSEGGLRSYLFDLPGHGGNVDAFSFPRADDCARTVVASLIRSREIDSKRTIVVGHSMGGAIAIRAADREPVAGTIALSPAPMPLPRRMPANLLVFSAQYDLALLRRAARTLATAAGGDRTQPDDFVKARAFHLQVVSWSDHTSLLTDRRVFRQASDWIDRTLGSARGEKSVASGSYPHEDIAAFAGSLGFLLLFPLCGTLTVKFAGPAGPDAPSARLSAKLVLAEGAVCALAAVLILAAFIPLSVLHLYTGDYLASLLLISGILLLALNWKSADASQHWNPQRILPAAILGFVFMLAVGAWLNWRTAGVWLNGPRWLRFGAILPVAWLFCFAEEIVLGHVIRGRSRILRFFLFLSLRAEFWLACLFAYYALASSQVLILILVPSLALFSILQRLAADALRVRMTSPAAAALFSAILAAWFIAAVFPLT
jgi:pimeloyl-ACP methyl ester carboxylesterase